MSSDDAGYPQPVSFGKRLAGFLLSGRLLILLAVVGLATAALVAVWRSSSDFWFSLGVEFAAGCALYLGIQTIPQGALTRRCVALLVILSIALLAVAYQSQAHLQSLLIELGAGILLFIALELWLRNKLLVIAARERRIVADLIEHFQSREETGWDPEEFDPQEYLDGLREAHGDGFTWNILGLAPSREDDDRPNNA